MSVPLSSLQQLLELKNRVLMALQKHGIGKPVQAVGASGAVSASGAATPGVSRPAPGAASPAASAVQPELSPVTLGVAAAIGAALLALILRLLIRKRKKPVVAEAAPLDVPGAPVANEAAEPPVLETPLREAPAAAVPPAEVPRHDEMPEHATDPASVPAAADPGGEALAPAHSEAAHELPEQDTQASPQEEPEEPGPATTHGVEPGAAALPPEGLASGRGEGEAEEPAPAAEPALPEAAPEPHGDATPDEHAAEPSLPPTEPEVPALDLGAPHAVPEPQLSLPPHPEGTPFPEVVPFAEPVLPAVAAEDMNYPAVPPAFPLDAVHALGGLDMPLPPRIEADPADPFAAHAPLSTEPVNSPETTAAQAMPFAEPPAPPAGEAIEAGTAGPGAIAGLGAPRFGPLTLDFDLNLPPDLAEPLPVFTPEQLARIARNKLELAHEYIALGDLAGARSLINEVIESNDYATRSDAQALLSTLAPLS